jgi:hypothetical protein
MFGTPVEIDADERASKAAAIAGRNPAPNAERRLGEEVRHGHL